MENEKKLDSDGINNNNNNNNDKGKGKLKDETLLDSDDSSTESSFNNKGSQDKGKSRATDEDLKAWAYESHVNKEEYEKLEKIKKKFEEFEKNDEKLKEYLDDYADKRKNIAQNMTENHQRYINDLGESSRNFDEVFDRTVNDITPFQSGMPASLMNKIIERKHALDEQVEEDKKRFKLDFENRDKDNLFKPQPKIKTDDTSDNNNKTVDTYTDNDHKISTTPTDNINISGFNPLNIDPAEFNRMMLEGKVKMEDDFSDKGSNSFYYDSADFESNDGFQHYDPADFEFGTPSRPDDTSVFKPKSDDNSSEKPSSNLSHMMDEPLENTSNVTVPTEDTSNIVDPVEDTSNLNQSSNESLTSDVVDNSDALNLLFSDEKKEDNDSNDKDDKDNKDDKDDKDNKDDDNKSKNTGSLIDDYADVSTEPADWFGGDD